MGKEIRHAIRSLLRAPGFTAVTIITLALGIGANTAIFSVVNSVLLKPLQYNQPDRIVTILHGGRQPVATADFLDWRNESGSFDRMAAAQAWSGSLEGSDHAESVPAIRYGEGMFEVLGIQPLLGRTFQSDDYKAGNQQVLVLGHALWQRRFGGDQNVIGQWVTLNGVNYRIIGVMPPSFLFTPFWSSKAELAAPLDLTANVTNRGDNSLRIFARLKNGVTLEQAQADINTICARLAQAYPETNTGRTAQVDPLLEKVVSNMRQALWVLAGAVLFVLLIACANVANLMLVRGAARQKEMALRTALGARRWHLVRQSLTESALLMCASGFSGLVVAYGALTLIKQLLSGDSSVFKVRMPRLSEISIDTNALLFTVGVSVLIGLIFGLIPALQAMRAGTQETLKAGARSLTAGQGARQVRSVLVISEIALAMITMVGAGLMLRSFTRLSAIDPGFDSKNVVSMIVSLKGQAEIVNERRERFYQQLARNIESIPGVTSVSAINHLPLAGDRWGASVLVEGRPFPRPEEDTSAVFRVALPNYFQTLKIPVLSGRDFSSTDKTDSPGVIIINESLARKYWPNESPISKRVTLDDSRKSPKWLTIVGVVKNVKQDSWTDVVSPEFYIPFSQSPFLARFSEMTLVVRTASDPRALIGSIQSSVWQLNKNAPVSSVLTMDEVIANAVWQPHFNMFLIGLFAGLALLLGSVGIYGVMSFAVSQRTQEIGIRMALGATQLSVFRLVIRKGMTLVAIGVACGIAGSFALTRMMSTLIYEVEPTDPTSFGFALIVLTGVALLACYIPARRATKVDPLVALRYE